MRYANRITFGPIEVAISYQDGRSLIAKTPSLTISIIDAEWSFNGIAGLASGTLREE